LIPFLTAIPHVSSSTTLAFGVLLAFMVLALALEEVIHAKKSMITGVFAMVALLGAAVAGLLPFGAVTLPNGHHMELPVYIPAVDWGVITIILGSSLFVDTVGRSGIFTWTAIKLTKISGGDPLKLLCFYALLTVVFSAVLNNVTAMIIVGSLSAVSLAKLDKRELLLGFLLTEGLLTNIGGLLTLISSVPNIILGNQAGISFVRFFVVAAPYTVVTTLVTLAMAVSLFGIKPLRTESDKREAAARVAGFDENDGISSKGFFVASWILLGAFIVVIATTSVLPFVSSLGMGFVAMAFATLSMIRYKSSVDQNYQAMDWDLLFFFIYLFVVINVMEHAGVLHAIGGGISTLIELGDIVGTGALLVASALASAVTDNVPLAAVLGKILAARPGITADSPLWWAAIFGANLGGNFTPIGSASTVVAVSVMHRHGIKLSFVGFVKKALPFALVHVVLALAYVLLVLA
jgi:Na+/H+ antiporter NhaD/arsenite permease-like protein